jgi:hypothetical protein
MDAMSWETLLLHVLSTMMHCLTTGLKAMDPDNHQVKLWAKRNPSFKLIVSVISSQQRKTLGPSWQHWVTEPAWKPSSFWLLVMCDKSLWYFIYLSTYCSWKPRNYYVPYATSDSCLTHQYTPMCMLVPLPGMYSP